MAMGSAADLCIVPMQEELIRRIREIRRLASPAEENAPAGEPAETEAEADPVSDSDSGKQPAGKKDPGKE